MKKIVLLSTILFLVYSCSLSKKPKFKYINSVDVKNISMRNVTLAADAVFDNSNYLNGKISIDEMQVFVDNIHVGSVSSKEFNVPSKGEFTIPLEGTFSLSKIYNNNKNDLLGSILKIVNTDSVSVQYKGKLRYHFGNFSYLYTIDEKQPVIIKR